MKNSLTVNAYANKPSQRTKSSKTSEEVFRSVFDNTQTKESKLAKEAIAETDSNALINVNQMVLLIDLNNANPQMYAENSEESLSVAISNFENFNNTKVDMESLLTDQVTDLASYTKLVNKLDGKSAISDISVLGQILLDVENSQERLDNTISQLPKNVQEFAREHINSLFEEELTQRLNGTKEQISTAEGIEQQLFKANSIFSNEIFGSEVQKVSKEFQELTGGQDIKVVDHHEVSKQQDNSISETFDLKHFTNSTNQTAKSNQLTVEVKEIPVVKLKQEITELISSKAKVLKNDEFSEIRIFLKPANLGRLTLQVTMKDGVVATKILAEQHTSKELLEFVMPQLKENLNNQGFKVGSFDVALMYQQQEKQQAFWYKKKANKKFLIQDTNTVEGSFLSQQAMRTKGINNYGGLVEYVV